MVERQADVHHVVRAEPRRLGDGLAEHVVMVVREHHALRDAGRARGIEDVERVIPLDRGAGTLGHAAEQLFVADEPEFALEARALGRAAHDERRDLEDRVRDRRDKRQELRVDQHDRGVAVVEEVNQQVLLGEHVDRDHHRACLGDAELRVEVLDAVRQHHRDLVFLRDAQPGRKEIGDAVRSFQPTHGRLPASPRRGRRPWFQESSPSRPGSKA